VYHLDIDSKVPRKSTATAHARVCACELRRRCHFEHISALVKWQPNNMVWLSLSPIAHHE